MRFVVALGALAAAQLAGAQPSRANYEGPWCAQFWGGDTQVEKCDLRSFQMCLNEIRGTGGNTLCSPNPHYHPFVVAPKPRRRHPA